MIAALQGQTGGLSQMPSLVPAPWRLEGRGLILFHRVETSWLAQQPCLQPAIAGGGRKRLVVTMFVDYRAAPVGPYRELLFIPGRRSIGGQNLRTIEPIFVSTEASVVNGRRNWGIPKQLAQFSWEKDEGQETTSILVRHDGREIAGLRYRPGNWRLPFGTAFLPERLTRLGQRLGASEFRFAPRASGRIGPARILSLWSNPAYFPDLSMARPIAALAVDGFRMVFPPALISPVRTEP